MFTIFILFFAVAVAIFSMVAIAGLLKFTFHAVFWPLKLLLLPFILVAVIVKIVLVFTFLTVVVALLLPLFVVGLIFAVPVILFAALA